MEVPQRLATSRTRSIPHVSAVPVARCTSSSVSLIPELCPVAPLVAGEDAAMGPNANGCQGDAEPCCRHSQRHEPVRARYSTFCVRGTCGWNVVHMPHGRDPDGSPRLAVAGPQALCRQRSRDLVIRHLGSQGSDGVERVGWGAEMIAHAGAVDPVCCFRATAPEDKDVCAPSFRLHGHRDGGDDEPEQALAIHRRRRVGMPECRQIRRQATHFLDFELIEGTQLGLAQALVVFLQLRDLAERRLPAVLQLACDQTIVGVHRVVLPLREACLVTGTFETKLPLPVSALALSPQLTQGNQCGLEPGWLHSLEECLHDKATPRNWRSIRADFGAATGLRKLLPMARLFLGVA